MMKMSNIEGNTLYTIELIGIKNKSDLIDEPLSEEAIRASDPIIKLTIITIKCQFMLNL